MKPLTKKVYSVYIECNSELSFSSKLAEILCSHGLRPWSELRGILPGQHFSTQLSTALDSSRSLMMLFGPTSLKEEKKNIKMQERVRAAKEMGLPLFFVLLPGFYASIRHLNKMFGVEALPIDMRASIDSRVLIRSVKAQIPAINYEKVLRTSNNSTCVNQNPNSEILNIFKRHTIHSYDIIAEKFAAIWVNHPPISVLDKFLSLIPRNSTILDAGCGPGHHAKYLASNGHNIIGIDLSEQMLKIARRSVHAVRFIRMDMQMLRFHRYTFDAIWCAASAIHIPREEILELLKGFKAVMRPGGILGLNMQIGRRSEIASHSGDCRFFEYYENVNQISHIIENAGFKMIGADYGETMRNTHSAELTLKWQTVFATPVQAIIDFNKENIASASIIT